MRSFLLCMLLATATAAPAQYKPATPPPPIKPAPVSETYHGTTVVDRYRQLEKLDAPTLDWMRAQGAYTRGLLDRIAPLAAYRARLGQFGSQFGFVRNVGYAGDRLFFLSRAPGRDAYDLAVKDKGGEPRRLIDVAALIAASGNTPHAVDYFEPSPDGSRVAVGISASGSEDAQLTIVDATTGKTVAGPISRAQFGGVNWTEDGKGLFFTRLAEGATGAAKYNNSSVVFWTGSGEPRAVVGAAEKLGPNTDPVRFPFIQTVPGSDQVMLFVANGVANEVEAWSAPGAAAAAGTATWRKMISTDDAVTGAAIGADRIYLLSHRDAPTFKVTSMPWSGEARTAETVIATSPDRLLESVALAADALYVGGRAGLQGQILRVPTGGAAAPIALPASGTVSGLDADPRRPGIVFAIDGYARPLTTYAYDPATRASADLRLEQRPALDLGKYQATELRAKAKDGTMVPLTVLTVAGPPQPRPLLLDAYGAYGVSALPAFSPRFLAFVEAGGSYAECNVRGGGELGEAWRLGGKDATKPNTWRDAIACAETLIAKGYTTSKMLTITGTSAGGIMVGRAATERPDLFAGAVTRVGDSNALRSETMPGGPANIPEFGTVVDPQQFKNLLAMDAYQHVVDRTRYPAWMLTTGLTDPRVAPWQAAKMTARLQEATTGGPVLLRVEAQAGHGLGTTKSTRDAEEADIAAFVFWQAGKADWQPR